MVWRSHLLMKLEMPGSQFWILKPHIANKKLDIFTRKRGNFSIFGGKIKDTYRVLTGFYGLRTMPNKLQKKLKIISFLYQ